VTGAFAYLILTSTRNKLRSKIRQVRNPRYSIALLLGIGYFWMIFFNGSARHDGQPSPLASKTFGAILPIMIVVYVAFLWIFSADRTSLAFSEAEVAMLFPAPVSRRGLVIYKLVRAQAAVLTTSVIWLVLFHSAGRGLPSIVASWVLLTTLSLHRLGATLLRAAPAEHGSTGARKNWLPITLFGVAASIVIFQLVAARALFAAADAGALGQVLVAEFAKAPLSWVLFPFHIAVAPMFAHSPEAWVRAIFPALGLLALHVVWVVRSDTAFEEAAAEASAKQAERVQALRARGATGGIVNPKNARRTIMLGPTGSPAIALIWKNLLLLIRTGQWRSILGIPAIALACCLSFAGRSTMAEILVVVGCSVTAAVSLIFGPMTMRNDLRADLPRLPILKTMPLTGREIMLAEVTSTALPAAVMQFLLAAVGLLALSFISEAPIPTDVRIGMVIASPILLVGLSIANFTIHNGMALLFPAWVRLGTSGDAGVEAMGQMMLTSIVTLLLLAILLILPTISGAAVYFAMHWPPLLAVAGAGIAAGVACGLEGYLLIGALGGVLDRLEPMQIE
jgi:hypothetical protein